MLKTFIAVILLLMTATLVHAEEAPFITIGERNLCEEYTEGFQFKVEVKDKTSEMFYGYGATAAGATVTISSPGVSSISIIDFEKQDIFAAPLAESNGNSLTYTFDRPMKFAFWLVFEGSAGKTLEATIACGETDEAALSPTAVPTQSLSQDAAATEDTDRFDDGRNSFTLPASWSVQARNPKSVENVYIIKIDGETEALAFFYPIHPNDPDLKTFPADGLDSQLVEMANSAFAGIFQSNVQVSKVAPLPFDSRGVYLQGTSGANSAGAALVRYSDTQAVVIIGISPSQTLIDDMLAFIQSVRMEGTQPAADAETTPDVVETSVSEPRIVFITPDKKIATIAVDGSDQQELTISRPYLFPRWSPDGSKIAYQLGDNRKSFLVMNRDGSGNTLVGDCPGTGYFCAGPVWSPDGTRLAFLTTDASSSLSIHILTLGTKEIQTITPTFFGYSYTAPAWSPDGSKIAFTYIDGGVESLGILNVASGQASQTSFRDESGIFRSGLRWTEDSKAVAVGIGFSGYYLYDVAAGKTQTVPLDAIGSLDHVFADGSVRVLNGNIFTTYSADGEVLSSVEVPGESADWQPELAAVVADTADSASATVTCTLTAHKTVNQRGGAGVNFDIVGKLNNGDTVPALSQLPGENGLVWWQIGDNAWVRSDTVEASDGCSQLLQFTTASGVSVSTSSSTETSGEEDGFVMSGLRLRKPLNEAEANSYPNVWDDIEFQAHDGPSTLTYDKTVTAGAGTYVIRVGWCENTDDLLQQDLKIMTFDSLIDGEVIPEAYTLQFIDTTDELVCSLKATIVDGFEDGKTYKIAVIASINGTIAGDATYTPGDYTDVITLSVK